MTRPETVNSLALTRRDAQRVLQEIANYPLLVPDFGADINRLLLAGNIGHFIEELHRLAMLGSHPSAALLGYLHLSGGVQGHPNLPMAAQACEASATAGYPYSQYVMAWICKARGQNSEAMAWMRKAAVIGLFPPAGVDLGKFIIAGVGVDVADTTAGLKILWDAHRLGHRVALIAIAQSLRAGRCGFLGKLAGQLLLPVAILRSTRFAMRHPLSEMVFVHVEHRSRPLFKVATVPPTASALGAN